MEDTISRGSRRRTWWLPALCTAILLLCGLVRGWVIAHTEVISRDGTVYSEMARRWPDEPGAAIREYDYPPGYPAAVAGVRRALAGVLPEGRPGWDLAGQLVSLAAGVAGTAAVFVLGGMTMGWPAGAAGALLWGVGRKWAHLGADVLSDPLAVALALWAVVAGLAASRRLARPGPAGYLLAAGAGLGAGAGYLVRPEELAAALLALVLLAAAAFARKVPWRRALPAAGIVLLGAAAVAAPYVHAIGGLSKKKQIEDIAAGPGRLPLALAGPVGSPDGYVAPRQLLNMLYEAWHPVVGSLVVLWLVGLFILKVLKRDPLPGSLRLPTRDGTVLMLAATVLLGGVAVGLYVNVGYMSHRHVLLLAALLVPLAGGGAVLLAEALRRGLRRLRGGPELRGPTGRYGTLAVLTGVLLAAMLSHALRPLGEGKLYHRLAGRYLAAAARPGEEVLTDSVWVLHYSGLPGVHLRLPEGNVEHVRRVIGSHGGDYLALTGGVLQRHEDLGDSAGPAVKAFVQAGAEEPERIWIYRIRPEAR